ncbi:hypothetical protein LSAT2_023504 [Lamellibrachia satsuma]|nr:hypothetical protein LSAT2_023504 [Lamellibrachia satsuma]
MYYYLYRPRVYRPLFWVTSAFTSYPQDSESQYSDETEKTEKRPRRRCGAWWVAPCCCLLTFLATALLLGLVGGLVVLPALAKNPNAWPRSGNSSSETGQVVCDTNCARCVTNGPGKCDYNCCNHGYSYNNESQTCDGT